MKRKNVLIWIGILLISFLVIKGGYSLVARVVSPDSRDWSLELMNGYFLKRASSQEIIVAKKNLHNGQLEDTEIPAYIGAYCYGERFLAVQQSEVPTKLEQKVDTSQYCYYLLDTQTQEVYGPFAQESAFLAACKEYAADLGEWTPTSPIPKEAKSGVFY